MIIEYKVSNSNNNRHYFILGYCFAEQTRSSSPIFSCQILFLRIGKTGIVAENPCHFGRGPNSLTALAPVYRSLVYQ